MDIENCHDRGGTVCNLASCYSLYSADVLTKTSDPIKQRRVYLGKLKKTCFNLPASQRCEHPAASLTEIYQSDLLGWNDRWNQTNQLFLSGEESDVYVSSVV